MALLSAELAAFQSLVAQQSAGSVLFLILAALVAGLARGFSGFGGALIFMPAASSVIDPTLAAAVLFIIDAAMTAPMIPHAFRRADKKAVALMTAGALIGIPIGTLLLTRTDPLVLRWFIVSVVVAMLALLISGWRFRGTPSAPLTIGVGAVSGLFGGAAQIGGPPVVAYWLGGVIPAVVVRANIVLYFGATTAITAINYLLAGILVREAFFLALLVAPAFGIGLVSGSRLFGLANDVTFRRICFGLIAVAAVIGLPVLDPLLR
ncbi:sulfite exporter TauE/SafE family protein [Agrobacterium sp. a22-2]|uniref:sulfite exporter TauE/SafE family protein n=1 Tax=Agrobacterium sp. a22-2 TaxID=2283840 RepID=UPI0014467D68|nr:sulfite exporter TauE/SafE family protein [Agrobacterium sp. a22-2]NKN39437.1 sulfite exporter TauE/SafE family protein [Agrobacterium sp. a22-2]